MVTSRLIRLTSALVLICMSIPALSAEPNQPSKELQFATDIAPAEVEFDKHPQIVPSYMANFTVHWCFEQPREPDAADLLNTSAGKTLSALQRELLETERAFWWRFVTSKAQLARHGAPTIVGSAHYEAKAVSEEDAKKMACAIVEFVVKNETASARRMKRNQVEKLSAMREELKKKLAKTKEQREATASEMTAAYQKYMDAVANSPYSLYPRNEVSGEVRKTIIEMNKTLDALNIEMAGIQSKLAAIKKYSSQSEVRNRETLSTALKEMAIREEIELVGAESRRQAIMDTKRREVYGQFEAYSRLYSTLSNMDQSVMGDESELKRLDEDINRLGPGEHTFVVGGRGTARFNVVEIQQVRVKERYLNPTKP